MPQSKSSLWKTGSKMSHFLTKNKICTYILGTIYSTQIPSEWQNFPKRSRSKPTMQKSLTYKFVLNYIQYWGTNCKISLFKEIIKTWANFNAKYLENGLKFWKVFLGEHKMYPLARRKDPESFRSFHSGIRLLHVF